MKIPRTIVKYILRLTAVWIIGLFLLTIDLLGGVEKLIPWIELPRWIYFSVFIVSFVIANAYLFVNHELIIQMLNVHIAELEALEADIQIKIRERSKLGINEQTIDKQGLPSRGVVEVILEFENVGQKSGELVWEIDRAETKIQPPFKLDPSNDGGFNIPLHSINGQERTQRYLIIPIMVAEKDPIQFAKLFSSLENYIIVMRYHTKRIGDASLEQKLIIRGSFRDTRQQVRNYYENAGLDDLSRLIIT